MPSSAPRRVGLLGGSFNPAHDGHLHISRLALELLRLDQVWWLVSPQNPLKPKLDMAPLKDRLAAAEKLVDDPLIRVTDLERGLGTTYTVDTVRALKRQFPATRFVWVMGADNLIQMPRWRRWRALFRAIAIAVFARPPYSLKVRSSLAARRFAGSRVREYRAANLVDMKPPAWVYLNIRPHGASATEIRHQRPIGKEGRKEG